MQRFDNEAAYILHTRSYRETSLLVEVFTYQHGRLTVVAKGIKNSKKRARGLLQPFVPLSISCSGRGELLTLKEFDPRGSIPFLKGTSLVSGFYINELLMRLLHRWDPHQQLFETYELTLRQLDLTEDPQPILRLFEKSLLKALGYELPLLFDGNTGQPIQPEQYYSFDPERGPVATEEELSDYEKKNQFYRGEALLALAQEKVEDKVILSDLKRLMRHVLALYLDYKPLETRKLL